MIVYFPEIYPDELVYSWFCRYAIHSGYVTNSQVLKNLYCKKSDTPIKEFIGNLNTKARKCIDKIYPLRELVLNHTMYPQYARFIPLEQKKNALYKLCNENCDAHHLFAIRPRCEKEQYLKYCPMCAKEDRQKYGEAYWHRKHQIRNIGICSKHKCKLYDSTVSAKNMNIYNFYAAEINIPDSEKSIIIDNPLQIKFAEYTEQIFNTSINFKKDIPLSTILYHAMRNTEYMKSTGSCRYMAKFVNDMTYFYEQIELNDIASISRIQRTLLSGERYDFSLTCQIGFFLNMLPEELTDSQLSEKNIKQEEESHYIKGNTIPDWEEYDTKMSTFIKRVSKDIYMGNANDIGKPEKVTKKLICKIVGIKEHRFENMPKCKALLQKYSESYAELWARQLVWCYSMLLENKETICWTKMRKITNIKKENFNKIKLYLKKYTNDCVAREIEKIVYNKNRKNKVV